MTSRSAAAALLASAGMPAATGRTITQAEVLLRDLGQIRRQRLALDDEEREVGTRCVAVPVYGAEEQVVAALSVSGPAERLDAEHLKRYGRHLRKISTSLSSALAAGTLGRSDGTRADEVLLGDAGES